MKKKYYISVLLGASLWGTIGIFVKDLYAMGFTALQIVAIRSVCATIILLAYTYYKDKNLLKINIRDIYLFVGTGLFSIVFFSWCYFFTIGETSVAMAVILLYTAPSIVTILSRIFFKELLTPAKFGALILTFIGLILITGVYKGENMSLSIIGLITGMGSALGYALYSIFGKLALRKYHAITLTVYTFVIATIMMLPVLMTIPIGEIGFSNRMMFQIVNLGLFPTAMAYIFYTNGLVHLESSRASITATIEPVVATMIGIFVFKEVMDFAQWIGIIMIFLSIFMVQIETRPQK